MPINDSGKDIRVLIFYSSALDK